MFSLKVGESWHEEPESMVYQKRYAESIVFNGEMLVMGGYNQNIGWLNAVEKRSSDGSWTEMELWTLPRMIFDFCAVQMDENRIMVLGKAYTFCLFIHIPKIYLGLGFEFGPQRVRDLAIVFP